MPRKIVAAALTALALACASDGGRQDVPTTRDEGSANGGPAASAPVILFLGTSLTAGLGVAKEEAYPALIQHKLDSVGLDFRVVNAGVSGETSAGGLRRIDWLLHQPVSILVLELGANDGLRGQDVGALRNNLQQIIARLRDAHPGARTVVVGMEAPPNLGRRYATAFARVFPEVAQENGAALVPFLLEGVGGVPELNQSDGIHPTAEGHRVLAENVWGVLEDVAREVAVARAMVR
jgi:acyl-CoA thioesterase-1